MTELAAAGVPCSAVLDTRDLFRDANLRARGFLKEVNHETLGTIRLLGWAARMSESEVPIEAAPVLGRHTAEVLASDLGLRDREFRALREQGAIGHETYKEGENP